VSIRITSVRAKSSPLMSSGSLRTFASAYAKQSPKLSPAGCRPLPNRTNASRAQCLLDVDRLDLDVRSLEEPVERAESRGADARLDHDRGFDESRGGDPTRISHLDRLVECAPFGLVLEYGEQRRRIDDHQRGKPLSSYPRISSAGRSSLTGSAAHSRAISSSSSASRCPARSRRNLASRSRSARVTASVLVSPASFATASARRSASGLRMSAAHRY